MGKPSTSDPDVARAVVSGAAVATGESAAVILRGRAHLALWGTFSATIVLQRSFDGGTTWLPAMYLNGSTAISFTAAVATVIDCGEEDGVLHRLGITRSSGTINYRLSQ